MNSMDLIYALQNIDEDLIFDAANGGAKPQKSAGVAPVKQPKNNQPRRGGVKTKAIVIGAVAMVLAAAIVCMVLYFTGIFGGKQVPIYTGMEISSVNTTSDNGSTSAVSYKCGGDYAGKNDDVDKNNPFGDDSLTIEQQAESTLKIVSSGESIYYADAGDDIYITIKFDNPDYYDIVSFVLSYGSSELHYTSYMFESGSDYENVIIKLNVGTVGGIIEYTISEIKYIDDTVNRDVIMNGDPVVKCGVRTSGTTYASITDEEVTLTTISFTVNIVDKYSLLSYSEDYYIKAVLYDGDAFVRTVDLQVGENTVVFENLTSDTLYQYAVVGYYDNLSDSGATLNYLCKNAVYTAAVVLFDTIEVGQESISFGYSWYEGYENNITSLTLTGGGETKNLDASTTSVTGLLSNNEYALTAAYKGVNGETASITLEFTTEAKATPEVEITVTECTDSSLTFSIIYTDTDGVGAITAIELYNGETLVKAETNLSDGEHTFNGLTAYTLYTLKVSYSYDLNDGDGDHSAEQTSTEYTTPTVELSSVVLRNTSMAVSNGDTIILKLTVINPNGVTFDSVIVNGSEYMVVSQDSENVYVNITVGDQFEGGLTSLNLTGINFSVDGNAYEINVTADPVIVFINGEIAVESFTVVRLENDVYGEVDYAYTGEALYYAVLLDNVTGYDVNSVTIGGAVYSSDDENFSVSQDKQTVYVSFTCNGEGYISAKLSGISYINDYMNEAKSKSASLTVTYFALAESEVVEIYTADDLKNMTSKEYKCYKLMNDISLSEESWVNISNCMYGVFDGNGYTISGLGAVDSYADTTLYLGLFYYAKGYVTNLTMNDMYYYVSLSGSGYVYAGAVAATGEVTVQNCTIKSTILTNGSCKYTYVGGLVGYGTANVNDSAITSTLTVTSTNNAAKTSISGTNSDRCMLYVGGIIGSGNGNITNSTITNTINFTLYCKAAGEIGFSVMGWYDYGYVGGVSGNGTVNIYNSEITSTVKSTANSMAYIYLTSSDIGEISGSTIAATCTIVDQVEYYSTVFMVSTTKVEVTDSTLSYTTNNNNYTYTYDSDGNLVE